MVLLRDFCRRHRRPHVRAAAGRRDRLDRRYAGDGAFRVRLLQPGAAGEDRLQPGPRLFELGAFRLLQYHGVADLRRVYVRSWLRQDRPRTAHRADASQGDGAQDAHTRLRGVDCGHAARAFHPFQYGAQRRHDLSRDPQPAAALRFEAERPLHAAHGILFHVGGNRRDLRDQLYVPHRACAEPARCRIGEKHRENRT